jgi:hypothetical protein
LSVFSQVRSGRFAEVAVVGGLAVDRAQQVELLDDVGGLEAEDLRTAGDLLVGTLPVPKVSMCRR